MENSFVFVDAKRFPYKIWIFKNPVELLIVRRPKDIREFFVKMENFLKRGYYLAGFFSYELGYCLERKLEPLAKDSYDFPLAYFGVFRNPIITSKVFLPDHNFERGFSSLEPNVSKKEYLESIEKIKAYIAQGDTYQVNYTFKMKFIFNGNLERLFHQLLFSQRCEYGFFIEGKEFSILSLSPELFLKKIGKTLTSSPMKGTMPRAYLLKEDRVHRLLLKSDVKNRAENVMIVDLIRNDLGRICRKGTVHVPELFKIKTYPTIHQMISTVRGLTKTESLFQIFKALFPCGSITGAPKIRTMEIIYEIEKEERKIYTGAIGFITPKRDFLFNVAIRTLLFQGFDDSCSYKGEAGIGGGIVWDSKAEEEYEEALLKARFFTNPVPYFELFETMYFSSHTDNALLPLHYKRLKDSARYFQFNLPKELVNKKRWIGFLEENVKENMEPLRLRVKLSPQGNIKIETFPFDPWPDFLRIGFKKRDSGIGLFFFHKTTNRKEYDHFRKQCQILGLTEIVFHNEDGFLLEGTISNIFVDFGEGQLYTPPLELGILNGVMRQSLMLQKKVVERKIHLEDLKKAKLIFIGNALRGFGKVQDWVFL